MATRKKVPPTVPNRALHAGYDIYTPEKEPKEWPKCHTCGRDMLCEGEQFGPTGFAEAMAHRGHKYIKYVCADAGEDWHNQCIAILQQIQKTPSAEIEKKLREEIEQIKKTKKATKKVSSFFW